MKKKNTTSTTDNSQDNNTLLGLSADNNEEHILGADVPIVNVNIDLSGVEEKLEEISKTQKKIYNLLLKDDTNVALKAMLWTTLTLHFKAIQKMPTIFKNNLRNSKSVLEDMIDDLDKVDRNDILT